MLTLARTNTIDDTAELRRLIERERTILRQDSSKIVLTHDFFDATRCPNYLSPHGVFSQIFGKCAEAIGKTLTSHVRAKKVGVLLVSYDELQGGIKREI